MKKNETKAVSKADATAGQEQVTAVPASPAVQEVSEASEASESSQEKSVTEPKSDTTAMENPVQATSEAPAGLQAQEASEVPERELSANKTKAKTKPKPNYPDFLKSYIKAYPHNRVFYVTSDRMVFLSGDHSLAILHQNGLGCGEVETYTI